ncbi:MAG: hypothetical protein A2V69_01475 [Candidatus Portnoybacteria bacterium RBG_13_40_8]|uniref:Capsule polysaccharide biosynthesis protein n=1 Tax=Candidatus Portnoybacteria bacterium RBG_13_40_8 TaxID=1801990 RepID=A0A1G2F6K4_9BACT|nr:MAG: hypothetical protein A2V69_01475 [Candidatus Portnoybacteria bacterium RBG_13_40_8]
MINRFIKENRKFWSQFTIKDSGKKILIEEPRRAMIIHTSAIFAMIINQAKGYTPAWLCKKGCLERQFLQSYFPDIEIVTTRKKSLVRELRKLRAIVIALLKFLKVLFTKDILGIRYDGVKYGDIVYDTYLHENHVATIKKIDFKIFKITALCIFRHLKIKNILQNGNYAGVLVSHQQGIIGGVMLRSALRYGYQGYLHTGHHQATLRSFKSLKEIVHPNKSSQSDTQKIINQLGPRLKNVFLEVFRKEVSGKGSLDGPNAFSKNKKYYTDRTFFNKDFKLNPDKKNVFIMLHAFNDHPHTTFKWMVFKDYYDWFIQTLEFAKKNNKINWIFKQHPSIKWYITKDVNFKKLFSECSNNVIYIDENNQIDTRSLIYCADLIVTCTGSAGFELPAMGAIPSITAGDNRYTKLGFVLEPETKKEYFEILNRANEIEKLPAEAQNIAKAVYIYIHKISRIDLTACPLLSFSQLKDKAINDWYWNEILNQYSTKKNTILKELSCYIEAVRKPGFKKLTSKI